MSHSITRGAVRRISALALAAAGTILYAAAAGAATADAAAPAGTPGIVVKFGDLNLGTEAGVHRLYGRLVQAANQLCAVEFNNHDLRVMQMVQACRDEAVARAVREVASPRLAALAAAHSKAG
jgi:UrcA family protein